MIGTTISHYKILQKLGGGGMGVVYKAQDLKLDRHVALKFLPPELTLDPESKERFIHEAKAASALDHNNICTVHEIAETDDGQIFIVMACYEGETLKKKIERGPLKIEEATDLAIQIAQGLSEAHGHGIVHRDVKPANILITKSGVVKIVDFGLAKLAGQARLTKTGSTAGTAAYMSPEQAQGRDVDHRTDIWSMGVVLYEILTGHLPFKSEYEQALVYSILNEAPPSVILLRSDTPEQFDTIIRRAMEKDRSKRYQSMQEMASDLKAPKEPPIHSPEQEKSIVVLPFVNMSADPENEYFSDGLSESIINSLTTIRDLKIVARTSAFSFKGRNMDVREIGQKLGVSQILEGSVQKAGNRLRITAQLIDVADGYHHWSEKYDRTLDDVFSIQDEIAQKVVQALEVELSEKEKLALGRTATKDAQAYDFYLRGRKFFYQAQRKSIEFAREMFSRAIKKDPRYSLAYAGIADCCSWLFMYVESSKPNLDQSIAASQKALELDPELAEAHAASGLAISLSKQYEKAGEEFELAIQLNPQIFEAHYFYARTCFVQGKLEKAAQLFEKACLVNPDDYQAPLLLGSTYRFLHLSAKSEVAYQRGLEIVERRLEMNPDDTRAIYLGAQGFIELGEKEKGLEWANRALAVDPQDPVILYNVACAHSLLGNVQEAINYFERALEAGYAHKEWIENDGYLDSIRGHHRFQALLKKLE